MSANSLTQPNIENFLVTLEANAGTWESSRASLVEEQLLAALALHNEMLVEALETNPGMSESSRTSLAAQPHVSTLSRVVAGAVLTTASTLGSLALAAPPSAASLPAASTVAHVATFTKTSSASSLARSYDPPDRDTIAGQQPEVQQPRWLQYVMTRLDALGAAAGQSAPTPSSIVEARRKAFAMFGDNVASPSVVPSDDQGVMFVWHQSGWDLVITVEDQESFVWAQERTGGTTFSGPLDDRSRSVRQLLNLFST